jgi:hypothetical protein
MDYIPIDIAINDLVEAIELYEKYPPRLLYGHTIEHIIKEMKATLEGHKHMKEKLKDLPHKYILSVDKEDGTYRFQRIR